MGKFNSDDHYIYYCGQESLRRNGVALIVNKRVWNGVLEWSLKKWQNDLVSFPRQTIQYKSMYQPLMLKKLKLNGSVKTYRRRQWHPTPVLLPGKSHGWRSLVGCSPWGRWGSDTTDRLHFHFSLSCIGEGNGNPLQCSCLENPRDGGACWAAIYGVAQSWTRLKRLSSSKLRLG